MNSPQSKAKVLHDDHAFDASTLHKQLDAFDDWFGEKCELGPGASQSYDEDSDMEDSFAGDDSDSDSEEDDDMRKNPPQRKRSGALEAMFQGGNAGLNKPSSTASRGADGPPKPSSSRSNKDQADLERIKKLRSKRQDASSMLSPSKPSSGRTKASQSMHIRTFSHADPMDAGVPGKPSSRSRVIRTDLAARSEHVSRTSHRRMERRGSFSPAAASTTVPPNLSSPSSSKQLPDRPRRRSSIGGGTALDDPSAPSKTGERKLRSTPRSRDAMSTSEHHGRVRSSGDGLSRGSEHGSRRPNSARRSGSSAGVDELSRGSEHGARRPNSARRSGSSAGVEDLSRGSEHGSRRPNSARRLGSSAGVEDLSRGSEHGARRPNSARRSAPSASASDDLNAKSEHSRRHESKMRSDDNSRRTHHRRTTSSASNNGIGATNEDGRPSSDRRVGHRDPNKLGSRTGSSGDLGGTEIRSRTRRTPSSSGDSMSLSRSEHGRKSMHRRGSISPKPTQPLRKSSDDSMRHRRRVGDSSLVPDSDDSPSTRSTRGVRSVASSGMRSSRSRDSLASMRRERSSGNNLAGGMKRVDSAGSSINRAQARRNRTLGTSTSSSRMGTSNSRNKLDNMFDGGMEGGSKNATWSTMPPAKAGKNNEFVFDAFKI